MKYYLKENANFIHCTYPKDTEISLLNISETKEWARKHNSFIVGTDKLFRIKDHTFWLMESEWYTKDDE